jgi:hypothetical protein
METLYMLGILCVFVFCWMCFIVCLLTLFLVSPKAFKKGSNQIIYLKAQSYAWLIEKNKIDGRATVRSLQEIVLLQEMDGERLD